MEYKTLIISAIICFASLGCSTSINAAPAQAPKTRSPLAAWHFPNRLHTFIWRNWQSVSIDTMAKVLDTSPEAIREIGLAMGLPDQKSVSDQFIKRGYISLIRRNWHLISREQLLKLLGWSEEKLAVALREDDMLWVKLGGDHIDTKPLKYSPPNDDAKKRCEQIRQTIEKHFSNELAKPAAEESFHFVRELSATTGSKKRAKTEHSKDDKIRFIYSYFTCVSISRSN